MVDHVRNPPSLPGSEPKPIKLEIYIHPKPGEDPNFFHAFMNRNRVTNVIIVGHTGEVLVNAMPNQMARPSEIIIPPRKMS